MQRLITAESSVVVACDVAGLDELKNLVLQTRDVKGIGGYKVGAILGLNHGLGRVVSHIRELTNKPVIYDHQKAGTDIPAIGDKFSKTAKNSGVDALILFPFSGPSTEERWIKDCQDINLRVIVGGHMTHPEFLRKEGGFIADDAPSRMYKHAAQLGVRDFFLPGNIWPELILSYRRHIIGAAKTKEVVFYMPGFGLQGGVIENMVSVMGSNFHAVVGRQIYEAEDIRKAAEQAVAVLFKTAVRL
jgi:orotidine-5'-phosphate decarboxylase